jgi:hypothetical protein
MSDMTRALLLAAPLLLFAMPAAAQRPGEQMARGEEPRLIFEREAFTYPNGGRRDPFRALTGVETGPRFEELTLRMIIYSETPDLSIVTLSDGSNRMHRLRRGEVVGNATVLDIGPTRVIFAVDNLGVRRREILELKRTNPEGA